jgi:hypothetical protein
MKRIIFILVFISHSFVYAQISFNTISEYESIELFNSIEFLAEKKFDTLIVRILGIDNESGSAGFPTGEVTTIIYIAVSEYGEAPDHNLFKLSPLFVPQVLKIYEESSIPFVYMAFLENKTVRFIKLKIDLKQVQIEYLKNEEYVIINEPSVVFYKPTNEKIDSLLQDENSGFNEILSDFLYYSEQIEPYIKSVKIKPIHSSAHILYFRLRNKNPFTLFREDFEHSVGLILVNKKNDPFVLQGVYTDVFISEKIDNYFLH